MACRPIAAPMQARMVVTERRPKRDGVVGLFLPKVVAHFDCERQHLD